MKIRRCSFPDAVFLIVAWDIEQSFDRNRMSITNPTIKVIRVTCYDAFEIIVPFHNLAMNLHLYEKLACVR